MKRLNGYILKTFIPLFLMTFAICLFLVLMQFVWQYVEYMVGKGLEVRVLGEMFLYAALGLISLALPLAVLFSTIMLFGNMGESLELLAIKSAGISLLKMMRPLFILIICICIGAFFYQNYALPRVQAKSTALLQSIRLASPELDIPEGVFYRDIPGYNMYVGRRDFRTGMLYDVIIYDLSSGFHNMAVIAADSARMSVSEDRTMLIFTMYSGQQFQNFVQGGRTQRFNPGEFVPYARESFDIKTMMIAHDINFERIDTEVIETGGRRHVTMTMGELSLGIDSMRNFLDSVNLIDREIMRTTAFLTHRNNFPSDQRDSILTYVDFADIVVPSPATLVAYSELYRQLTIFQNAISRAENNRSEFLFRSIGNKANTQREINRHWAEWHRKLTMPFTCLIFFLIGAPLGAIVRKGGLGMPIVMSFLLFIVYYILDNTGFKMTRDGVWVHWFGMWFSSIILLPTGIFLTYKAMNDSPIMNIDTYLAFFRKVFFIREKRSYPPKNVIIEDPNYKQIIASLSELSDDINIYLKKYGRLSYKIYWTDSEYDRELFAIKSSMEVILDQLSNSRRLNELAKAEEFPILIDNVCPFQPGLLWARACMVVFPVGLVFKLISIPFEKRIRTDLKHSQKLCTEMRYVILQNLRDE